MTLTLLRAQHMFLLWSEMTVRNTMQIKVQRSINQHVSPACLHWLSPGLKLGCISTKRVDYQIQFHLFLPPPPILAPTLNHPSSTHPDLSKPLPTHPVSESPVLGLTHLSVLLWPAVASWFCLSLHLWRGLVPQIPHKFWSPCLSTTHSSCAFLGSLALFSCLCILCHLASLT